MGSEDIKFELWKGAPRMASYPSPAFLQQEPRDPVFAHYLAYEVDETRRNFAVIQFLCEDSGWVAYSQELANSLGLEIDTPGIYQIKSSPRGNGCDTEHWISVFPSGVYEVVGFAASVHKVTARNAGNAIATYLVDENANSPFI